MGLINKFQCIASIAVLIRESCFILQLSFCATIFQELISHNLRVLKTGMDRSFWPLLLMHVRLFIKTLCSHSDHLSEYNFTILQLKFISRIQQQSVTWLCMEHGWPHRKYQGAFQFHEGQHRILKWSRCSIPQIQIGSFRHGIITGSWFQRL